MDGGVIDVGETLMRFRVWRKYVLGDDVGAAAVLVIDPYLERSDEMAARSMISMSVTCSECEYEKLVMTSELGYQLWQRGKPVAKVMPELPAELQRALVLGRCPGCGAPAWLGDQAEVSGE